MLAFKFGIVKFRIQEMERDIIQSTLNNDGNFKIPGSIGYKIMSHKICKKNYRDVRPDNGDPICSQILL